MNSSTWHANGFSEFNFFFVFVFWVHASLRCIGQQAEKKWVPCHRAVWIDFHQSQRAHSYYPSSLSPGPCRFPWTGPCADACASSGPCPSRGPSPCASWAFSLSPWPPPSLSRWSWAFLSPPGGHAVISPRERKAKGRKRGGGGGFLQRAAPREPSLGDQRPPSDSPVQRAGWRPGRPPGASSPRGAAPAPSLPPSWSPCPRPPCGGSASPRSTGAAPACRRNHNIPAACSGSQGQRRRWAPWALRIPLPRNRGQSLSKNPHTLRLKNSCIHEEHSNERVGRKQKNITQFTRSLKKKKKGHGKTSSKNPWSPREEQWTQFIAAGDRETTSNRCRSKMHRAALC